MAPQTQGGVDFGSLKSPIYAGGFTLPAGRWAVWFDVVQQQPRENSTYKNVRLGVKLTAHPLDKPGAEPSEQFLSFGGKAHEAFVPTADGKGIQPIAGGTGKITDKSNWFLFRDSLYNSGLPDGIFVNDLSVLDGIWVVTDQVPEPEERKGFKTATSEVEEPNKVPGKIPVVVEILEGGKPWEGGGGIPAVAPKATAKPKPGTVAKPAPAKPAPVAAAAEEPAAGADADDVKNAAVLAIANILTDEKYAKGCPKLILQTGVFKAVGTPPDGSKEMAQAVQDTFFKNDEDLNALLGEIGYSLVGMKVVPAQA